MHSKLLNNPSKNSLMVMAVLNLTPDSFFDGGKYLAKNQYMSRVQSMVDSGVSIIDVGGESTRPFASFVPIDEELSRIIPAIEFIKKNFDVLVSVDTYKPQVMQAAIDAGADIVNDVRALQEPESVNVIKSSGVKVCLMHMQNKPHNMQINPVYINVVDDVIDFLDQRISVCVDAGIPRENIIVDPGFGFGKSLDDNYIILANIAKFKKFGLPVLVGLSNKSMIGDLLDKDLDNRLYGTLAANMIAMQSGANIFRVHDYVAAQDCIKVYQKYFFHKEG